MMTAEERCSEAERCDERRAVAGEAPIVHEEPEIVVDLTAGVEPRREAAPPTALGGFFGAAAGTGLGVVAFGATQNPVWMTTGVALGIGLGVLAGAIRERNHS